MIVPKYVFAKHIPVFVLCCAYAYVIQYALKMDTVKDKH